MFILMFSLLSSVQACTYQLNQTQARMGDRFIVFGDYLHQQIQAKGYTEVSEGNTPDYVVDLNLKTYHEKHFDHAQSNLSMIQVSNGAVFSKMADTTCFTQSCIPKDGAKVIRKSIDLFGKSLPACQ